MIKTSPATTYYVQHPEYRWWGYFTVNEALGLLQVDCDFGIFAHRWDQPGPDFKRFLIEAPHSYVSTKLERWARYCWRIDSKKDEADLQRRLDNLMTHLWPLFIEELKAERGGG